MSTRCCVMPSFCHVSYTAQLLLNPPIHLRHGLHPFRVPTLWCSNAAVSSLVVHSEPASSLDRPTPLIFIPTLHPHLHLSPPPRPPPPPSLSPPHFISLHLSPSSLPPSFRPPSLPHVPSLATASRRALCMRSAPSSILLFLPCACPSSPTLHLYHAAANESHFCVEASSRLSPCLLPYSPLDS